MTTRTAQSGSEHQPACCHHSNRELLIFATVLLFLECFYFSDALRPGRVLSAADWLLATESFRAPGEPEHEPTNRLLTDIACQMEPWMKLAADEWHAGRVPLWNPHAGCGAPLLANAQSGVFNPINFIYFLTRSPYSWVAMAMVKLFIAGIGAFLLATPVFLLLTTVGFLSMLRQAPRVLGRAEWRRHGRWRRIAREARAGLVDFPRTCWTACRIYLRRGFHPSMHDTDELVTRAFNRLHALRSPHVARPSPRTASTRSTPG